MPKLGPWVGELEHRLEANEKKPRRDRVSVLRIHEDLAAVGYGGGSDAVRRYARTWRRRWRLLSPLQGVVPLSFDPGEAYPFDWSHEYARLPGVATQVKAAHMRLCYSRMQRVQMFPRGEPGEGVRGTRTGLPLLRRGLPAGHLRPHEDGGEHGLCRHGARLQPALAGLEFGHDPAPGEPARFKEDRACTQDPHGISTEHAPHGRLVSANAVQMLNESAMGGSSASSTARTTNLSDPNVATALRHGAVPMSGHHPYLCHVIPPRACTRPLCRSMSSNQL